VEYPTLEAGAMSIQDQEDLKDFLADWLQDWTGRMRAPYRSVKNLLRDLDEAGWVVSRIPDS
jgi:hypothetical protein